jgi:hypothetical protein
VRKERDLESGQERELLIRKKKVIMKERLKWLYTACMHNLDMGLREKRDLGSDREREITLAKK